MQRTISLDEAAAEAALDLEELGSPNWDIFDGEWRYLGEVELPERFRLIRIAESGLYGVLSDENDVQFAVKLRLTRPGGHAGGAETS